MVSEAKWVGAWLWSKLEKSYSGFDSRHSPHSRVSRWPSHLDSESRVRWFDSSLGSMWSGVFSPNFVKSVGISGGTYIPLFSMSARNWQVLDWENLRNIAKNNLVDTASKSRITGFINVNLVQKGNIRDGYNVPVTVIDLPNLPALIEAPTLRNFADDPVLSLRAEQFDTVVKRAGNLFIAGGAGFLAERIKSSITDELDTEAEKTEARAYVDQIVNDEFQDYSEIDLALTWAMSVLANHDNEWLEDRVNEWEEVLGEAEARGQI